MIENLFPFILFQHLSELKDNKVILNTYILYYIYIDKINEYTRTNTHDSYKKKINTFIQVQLLDMSATKSETVLFSNFDK